MKDLLQINEKNLLSDVTRLQNLFVFFLYIKYNIIGEI